MIALTLILTAFALLKPTSGRCPSRPEHRCRSCGNLDPLRIMTLNTWGPSWFNDYPVPSAAEPFDLAKVTTSLKAYAANKPNPILGLLNVLPAQQLIALLNPSLKKQVRFQAICDFLKHEKFDVVFLQEVWFEKDYNFLAECTKSKYHISAYDKEFCGAADKMTPLNCSGVVTLSKHKLKGQRYVELDLGDATKVKVVDLYFTHFTNRKALYTDIEIEDCHFRLVNTHLSSYANETTQERAQRNIQIGQLLQGLGCGYDIAIVGMDMNDSPLIGPELQPYGQMIKAGFQDTANPRQESHEDFDDKVFMTTFGNAINSWTGDGSNQLTSTLDYIMTKSARHHDRKSHVEVKDHKVVDLKTRDSCQCSFSDHSAVMAKIQPKCS